MDLVLFTGVCLYHLPHHSCLPSPLIRVLPLLTMGEEVPFPLHWAPMFTCTIQKLHLYLLPPPLLLHLLSHAPILFPLSLPHSHPPALEGHLLRLLLHLLPLP